MHDVRHDNTSELSRSPQPPPLRSTEADRPHTRTPPDGRHSATVASGQSRGDPLSGLLQAAADRRALARSSLASPPVEITGRAPAHGSLLQRDGDDEYTPEELAYIKDLRLRIKLTEDSTGWVRDYVRRELEVYVDERRRGATHKWAREVAMTHGSAFPAPSWGAVFWGQSMAEAVKHARWKLPPEG